MGEKSTTMPCTVKAFGDEAVITGAVPNGFAVTYKGRHLRLAAKDLDDMIEQITRRFKEAKANRDAGEEVIRAVHPQVRKLYNFVGGLAARWHDEKLYEDINDYKKAIQAKCPKEFTVTKMIKRPFGFEFTHSGFKGRTFVVAIKARSTEFGLVEPKRKK